MSATRRVPAYQLIDGVRRFPYLDPALASQAAKYEPQDGDIVLLSYPKCGMLWTTQIIDLILHRGESASNYMELASRALSLETYGVAAIKNLPPPRIVQSHFHLLPHNFNARAKYVYVARNPWECCVSYFDMCRDLPFFKFEDGNFDDFVEAFLTRGLCNGDYFEHVRDGYLHKSEPNVLFLTYEALEADIPGTILKMANFLGDEYGKALKQHEDVLRDTVQRSSLEFMETVLKPRYSDITTIVEKFKEINFIRSGLTEENILETSQTNRKVQPHAWREYFTTEQAQRIRVKLEETAPDLSTLWDTV